MGIANLKLLEEIFQPLVSNPFFIKDSELRYVAVNRAMLDLCGRKYKEEMIGRTAWDMYSKFDAARYEAEERRVLSGATIFDRVEKVHALRRSPIWLILSQIPLRDEDGDIVGVIGIGRHASPDFADLRACDRFAAAVEHIRKNFDRPLNFHDVAAQAGFSISQLEREFRKMLNVTPTAYHQRVRIENAQTLLDNNLSVAEVAHLAGFTDHSSFTRRFKSVTGLTPTQYRSSRSGSADSFL